MPGLAGANTLVKGSMSMGRAQDYWLEQPVPAAMARQVEELSTAAVRERQAVERSRSETVVPVVAGIVERPAVGSLPGGRLVDIAAAVLADETLSEAASTPAVRPGTEVVEDIAAVNTAASLAGTVWRAAATAVVEPSDADASGIVEPNQPPSCRSSNRHLSGTD